MHRRDFVLSAGVAAAGLMSSVALGQDKKHEHHDHGVRKGRPASKQLKDLQASTFDCLRKGEVCLAACNEVLAGGTTSMADCQLSVLNMLAMVDGMSKVSTYNTANEKLMKSMAKTCADFCRACEKECKPHVESHPECKDCMDACIACAKACDAYVKA